MISKICGITLQTVNLGHFYQFATHLCCRT